LKFNESQVAQSLELLADFVVDMEVAGMQARQLGTAGINVRKREIFPAERPDDVKHIQRPAARFGL
jgi:hypothetical protein